MSYELLNQTFGQKLDEITELYPKNEALVCPEKNIRWDYREFRDRVNKVAKGLYAIGNTAAAILSTYPGPGCTLGPAMTYGYQAAKHISGYQEKS